MNRIIEDSLIFSITDGEITIRIVEEPFFPIQREGHIEVNIGGMLYTVDDEGLALRIIGVSRSFPIISIIITTPLVETSVEYWESGDYYKI